MERVAVWDEKMPALLMVYWSAAHKMRGYSPLKLVFGLELRLVVDLLIRNPPGEGLSMDAPGFPQDLEEWMSEVHHQV